MAEEPKIITPNVFEMQMRVSNCNIDIKKALDKWKCIIGPKITLSLGGFAGGWEVLPQEVVTSTEGGIKQ